MSESAALTITHAQNGRGKRIARFCPALFQREAPMEEGNVQGCMQGGALVQALKTRLQQTGIVEICEP